MMTLRTLKSIFLTICFLMALPAFMTFEVFAAGYYIDPVSGSDSDDGLSQTNAWATFAHAMGNLSAGDTLYLMDGTFTERLNVTISGSSGSPITFKALNDGQVTVDGGSTNNGFNADTGHSYIDVEGIIFRGSKQGSSTAAVNIHKANNLNFRRVSAYSDADVGEKTGTFVVSSSSYVLLEDCVATGRARVLYTIISSNNCTVRRCFGKWVGYNSTGGEPASIQIYKTRDSIVENCVFTAIAGNKIIGLNVLSKSGIECDNNKIYGNVLIDNNGAAYEVTVETGLPVNEDIDNIDFLDNVSVDCNVGYLIQAGNGVTITNTTTGNAANGGINIYHHSAYAYKMDVTLKNSVLDSIGKGGSALYVDSTELTFSNSYCDFYNNNVDYGGDASAGTGDMAVNPKYDTATYGNGAYLMIPTALKGKGENGGDIGAEVIYQYKNGKLTNKRLWPWPMEDRIFAETGISVTWEANGGLWKTLKDVYSVTSLDPPFIKIVE